MSRRIPSPPDVGPVVFLMGVGAGLIVLGSFLDFNKAFIVETRTMLPDYSGPTELLATRGLDTREGMAVLTVGLASVGLMLATALSDLGLIRFDGHSR